MSGAMLAAGHTELLGAIQNSYDPVIKLEESASVAFS